MDWATRPRRDNAALLARIIVVFTWATFTTMLDVIGVEYSESNFCYVLNGSALQVNGQDSAENIYYGSPTRRGKGGRRKNT